MEQPPWFVAQEKYGKVCKLKQSLYGLKQSLRAWFGRFSDMIIEFGMKRSSCDHTIFFKHIDSGCILLIVYVDDIVITESDAQGISSLKEFFQASFQTKDLGQLKYFLGIELAYSRKGIFLSQRKYVPDLLTDTGLLGAKSCETPMDPNVKLVVDEGEIFSEPEKYRRLVGKLNYLTITRSNIAFSVSVFSQFMTAPTTVHWDALIRIVRYLKGTPGKGIVYGDHGGIQIEGFTDADWAGLLNDRKSTTGYCVFMGENLIS